jgi:hypothetical protein
VPCRLARRAGERISRCLRCSSSLLREAERLLGEGKTIPEAAKELGISENT